MLYLVLGALFELLGEGLSDALPEVLSFLLAPMYDYFFNKPGPPFV